MLYNDLENYSALGIGFYMTNDESLKQFLNRYPDWIDEYLDDLLEWSRISYCKSLLEFFPDEDHVSSIQSFFIQKLGELSELKSINPNLDWRST